jgi:anti-anti-sigma factor
MAIVLRPHGKLDLKEAVKLKQKMHEVARTTELGSHQFWVVDLAKVNDIDHFGAVALLEIRRYAQQLEHKLFLSNVSNTVRSILNIAHLTQEFDFLAHNDCLPTVSPDSFSSQIPDRTQNCPTLAQFPIPASTHSHRLYKTIASLKSRFVEGSADLPVSV